LQLSALNVEYLVCAGHQPAQIVSLPFVHTARRCYRWQQDRAIRRPSGSKRVPTARSGAPSRAKIGQCPAARGSKSRNKVVVGEPAAGSLTHERTRRCRPAGDPDRERCCHRESSHRIPPASLHKGPGPVSIRGGDPALQPVWCGCGQGEPWKGGAVNAGKPANSGRAVSSPLLQGEPAPSQGFSPSNG
jgi:hypothetical protein